MAMSTGGSGGPMAEINVTPLVDVMLVLLIIFMITAPLMSHPVTITVPIANPKSTEDKAPETPPLDLAIKDDGSMYFQDQLVTEAGLKSQLAVAAQKSPQPELQIRADKAIEWKTVRKVISDAKGQGMVHVGFMTTAPAKE